ncbi:aminotransferase class IV [Streptomyces chrestomyceticus]|uniref:aminotransferase class IV n=1 Tax=Streptomyces chrestomyceticus TaxID=68185 RepID=UPI00367BD9A8
MNAFPDPYIDIDGRGAEAGTPLLFALMSGYGHFTAMQVRDGRVRGLGFHLARLDAATRELFGERLNGDLVRERIRHALGRKALRDASVRVYVYRPQPGDGPATLVTVKPPAPEPAAAQRLRSVPYQRPAAHIKHLGEFGQGLHLRQVTAAGFDEGLLVAPDGTVAEGTITNVGFVAGGTVVWPDAPALEGTTMLVLRQELERAGVPWREQAVHLDDLASFDGAFVSNSRGVAAVALVDDIPFPADADLVRAVTGLYAAAPWDAI